MKSRSKKLILVLLTAGLVFGTLLLGYLSSDVFEEHLRDRLVRELDRLSGGKAEVRSLQIRFFPIRVRMEGFTLRGREGASLPPLLAIDGVECRIRLRSLWGPLWLKDLKLNRPQIALRSFQDGSSNLPRPWSNLENINWFKIVIEQLRISQGFFEFDHQRQDFEAQVRDLILTAQLGAAGQSYRGALSYEGGQFRIGRDSWEYGLHLEAELFADEFRISQLRVGDALSHLEGSGWLRHFNRPAIQFAYRAVIDLKSTQRLVPHLRKPQGVIQLSGEYLRTDSRWTSGGTLSGSQLSANEVKIHNLTGHFSADPAGIVLENISLAGLGGGAEGRFVVLNPWAQPSYQTEARFWDVELSDLFALISKRNVYPSGQMQGDLKAQWRGTLRTFAGKGNLVIQPSSGSRAQSQMSGRVLPVTGELHFDIDGVSARFADSHLESTNTHLEFVGTLSPASTSDVRLHLTSDDLSDLDSLIPGLRGRASFLGAARGSLDAPRIRGNLLGQDLRFRQITADLVNGQIEGDKREVRLNRLALVKDRSRVVVDGRAFLDPSRYWPTGAAHLLLSLQACRLEDLSAMVGRELPMTGLVSGGFTVTGKLASPNVEGSVSLRQGRVWGQPIDAGEIELHYAAPWLDIRHAEATLKPGRIAGTARLNLDDQALQASVSGKGFLLERLEALKKLENPLTGKLDEIQIDVSGTASAPALEGKILLRDIQIAGEEMGDFVTRLHTEKQVVSFSTDSLRPAILLKATGTLDPSNAWDLHSTLSFQNFALSPYIRKVLPIAPETLTSQAQGEIVISGPLRHASRIRAGGRLDSLVIQFREARLETTQPFTFDYRDNKVLIKKASFSGTRTVLHLDGEVDLSRDRRLDMKMEGTFELALLNEFVRKLNASGNGVVNATIRGTLQDPRIQGRGSIANGQVSYGELPNSLSQLSASLFFDENQINISNLSASSGGGTVEVGGSVLFGQGALRNLNLKINAKEVRVRYPEGMRNVVDTELMLRGSQRSQLLSGNVRLVSSSFQKDYDPITEFLEKRQNRVSIPTEPLAGSLGLDLTVTGDRNINLDTSLVRITSRADLRVKGTTANPLITGSIEASSGELFFQGTRYRITRGRLDFLNPVKLDPRIDLEAEADVRDYRIILTLNGTADKIRADLRSDPPLPSMDLFSLVSSGGAGAGGLSGGAFSRPYSPTGRQQDSRTGATSLLSEGLSLKYSSRVKRLFGLDRFRVDPFLVGNERDPSARVTFGQQITRDLAITYSTSVSSNEQQVILLEYNVNDSTSIIASRDAEGSFGLDVRFRKRLRQKTK
ncbi:MAG: translocation/assembly module TamB domain-containing protein [Acidobacteriota bacterium]